MTARDSFMRLLDERLDHVLGNPRGWGGADALEPLVLMLLMLRAEISAPPLPRALVLRQYRRFLAERVTPGAGDLRERLGADLSLEAMVKLLREHTDTVRARSALSAPPPPDKATPPRGAVRHAFPRYQTVESL